MSEVKTKRKTARHNVRYDEIAEQKEVVIDHKTDTLVYAMGGLGEVGKNMYCVEHDDEIIIIDCGVIFPDSDLLGVDYVIPDFTYLQQNQSKIKALVITHGHEDHIGGLPFFLKQVRIKEIWAGPFAKALIEKKLDEHHLLRSVKIREINSEESRIRTKYFSIGFVDTVHSIPDSYGIFINTPNGRIFETGDFKFDLTPVGKNSDYQKMAYIGQIGVTLLMSDSTNSSVPGWSISEGKVAQAINEQMAKTPGRMIVSTFASNTYRLAQILEAAVACNRKVAVFGRSMENVLDIGRRLGYINIPDSSFITGNELNTLPANRICIVCTGSQGEPMAALSRIANGTHRFIKILPGDTVLFSSNPIPGNAVSVGGVINQLTRVGANVITNSPLTSFHTTGHAPQEEQKLMLNLIKPKYFMPVHGEYKHLDAHAKLAEELGMPHENIFIMKNGNILSVSQQSAKIEDEVVTSGKLLVDGLGVGDVGNIVLRDRKLLSESGLIIVVAAIEKGTGLLVSGPEILSRGFVYVRESEELINAAKEVVTEVLEYCQDKGLRDWSALKNAVRDDLRTFIYEQTKRSPIILPIFLEV